MHELLVCACAFYLCVCVCERERERQRQRDRDRETETDRQTDREGGWGGRFCVALLSVKHFVHPKVGALEISHCCYDYLAERQSASYKLTVTLAIVSHVSAV